ncbi:MAG TPA: hypothetical protein QF359_06505 [Rhodospirillales bacterium]|nr:hypothetical protein [Rhodospirillales bacterium]
MKICAFVITVFGTLPVLLAAVTVFVTSPVAAQGLANNGAPVVCDERNTTVFLLSDVYKESRNSIGSPIAEGSLKYFHRLTALGP